MTIKYRLRDGAEGCAKEAMDRVSRATALRQGGNSDAAFVELAGALDLLMRQVLKPEFLPAEK